ncbi:hypothetical protein SCE1572_05355 [Sorangium cellulosum So0157-2]|uniref:Uncharacterized protein n=1 Tax=Sorangium cellulosum So0157-2 TaxID=1254432 RepID=S4XQ89_SORCE|nr:hypothetical protein SCE1572_05355 [Sorangium cellulosum So0157-2]
MLAAVPPSFRPPDVDPTCRRVRGGAGLTAPRSLTSGGLAATVAGATLD